MDRRTFLVTTTLSGGSLSLLPLSKMAAAVRTPDSLKILVLGGTSFVGPAIVEQAIEAGHEVSLFNRGITRPHLFPQLEKLRGDRRLGLKGLAALGKDRQWDAVIDVWPADSNMVTESAKLLADRTNYYFFVSSIGVYRSYQDPGMDENSPLRLTDEGYGGEKSRSEKVVAEVFPNAHGIARCHSIFGPRDPGSTLHYWLRTCAQNDQVIAPAPGDDPVQFIDVRDLARWILDSVTVSRNGVYNIAGTPVEMRQLLEACQQVTGSTADLVWVDPEFLLSNEVGIFTELPLWIPVANDPEPGFFQISTEKAVADGLLVRPLNDTLAAAWRWYQSAFFDDTQFPHNGWGMSSARHSELLKKWLAARQPGMNP